MIPDWGEPSSWAGLHGRPGSAKGENVLTNGRNDHLVWVAVRAARWLHVRALKNAHVLPPLEGARAAAHRYRISDSAYLL